MHLHVPIPVACVLRSRSTAARLVGLRFRIPLRGKFSSVCLLCLVWVAASATNWSLVHRSPTVCVCLIVCGVEISTLRPSGTELVWCATEGKKQTHVIFDRYWPDFNMVSGSDPCLRPQNICHIQRATQYTSTTKFVQCLKIPSNSLTKTND
jgi:hypothetical protein